jgi:chromosome segregation ATPase
VGVLYRVVIPCFFSSWHTNKTNDRPTDSFSTTIIIIILSFQKLKEAEAHAAALQASTESLREEASSSQNRLERTVAALRIAGSNAAKARADADTAEATASSLSQSLQSLESVVTETKRACLVLQQEQTAVSSSATTIQATLLHKEADLARARKEVTVMRGQLRTLEASAARWQQDRKTLVQTSQHQQQELKRLEHAQTERDAMERARKERSDKVEHEWRQAQSMLVEATGGQAQAEQTQALLKETILELQCANKNLHENSWQQQESSRKEKDRLHDALTKAEKEAQQLRIQEEASGEDMQRLRLDKMAAEKQVSQLKIRVTGLERRLKDVAATSGGLVSPDALNNNTNDAISGIYVGLGTPNDTSSSAGSSSIGGFSLPPLSGSSRLSLGGGGQENSKNVTAPAKSCSVCFKAAFGLMKSCQCGQSGCDKRAHITCASRINPGPSVSHPGTPAPRLPLVLCTAVSAAGARAAGALKSN